MRDADEDEETRVLSADVARPLAAPPGQAAQRQAGLPPPLIQTEVTQATLADAGDEEATRLMPVEPASEGIWLVSDGPNSPVDYSHAKLLEALKNGTVSPMAFAWKKGMKQWQRVSELNVLTHPSPPSVPSSPPPKRSRPRSGSLPRGQGSATAPTSAAPPKPSARSVPSSKPTPKTPKASDDSARVLLSSSVSTADFSDVTPVQGKGRSTPPTLPKPVSDPAPKSGGELDDASEKTPPPQPRQAAPRPAAGRPPAPDEPVAKTVGETLPATVNPPPAVIVATGLAQAKANPRIETQRETTQPARSRLPLYQLAAAGKPPNLLLWVLGAGGWVLSGVLAGMLLAKNDEPPPIPSAATAAEPPKPTVVELPAAPAPTPVPTLAPAEPEAEPTEAATEETAPRPSPKRKLPVAPVAAPPRPAPVATVPNAPATIKPPEPSAPHAAGEDTPASASPGTDDINTPGF